MSDDDETETDAGVVARAKAIKATVGAALDQAIAALPQERVDALAGELADGRRAADYASLGVVSAAILGYHRGRRSVYLYLYLRFQYKLAAALHKKFLAEQTRRREAHERTLRESLRRVAGVSRPAAAQEATR